MPARHVTGRPLPLLTRISNDVHEPYGYSNYIEIHTERERERECVSTANDGLLIIKREYQG